MTESEQERRTQNERSRGKDSEHEVKRAKGKETWWDSFRVEREGRDSNRDREIENKRGEQAIEEERMSKEKRQRDRQQQVKRGRGKRERMSKRQ